MALNHLSLQGRFVADPATGTTVGGTEYANFRLAWSEKYKEKEAKCFIECKAFGNTAEFIKKYFSKGQEVIVEGKMNTDEWETQDGQKRSKLVLLVSGVHFCGKKQESGDDMKVNMTPVETDELPF